MLFPILVYLPRPYWSLLNIEYAHSILHVSDQEICITMCKSHGNSILGLSYEVSNESCTSRLSFNSNHCVSSVTFKGRFRPKERGCKDVLA